MPNRHDATSDNALAGRRARRWNHGLPADQCGGDRYQARLGVTLPIRNAGAIVLSTRKTANQPRP
jgi:hypothetical protein